MSEIRTSEPPKDPSSLTSNRAVASTVLDVLGYGSLATFGIAEHIDLSRKISVPPSTSGLLKSKVSQMPRIPDPGDAKRILKTAWTGLTGGSQEALKPTGEILDFRVVDPGAEITRSRNFETRENKPGKITYESNTQATDLLVRRIIRGLGFVDENQDLDRSMRNLRRHGVLTLAKGRLSITVTMPPAYRPEVPRLLDAAYRIQVQRAPVSVSTA